MRLQGPAGLLASDSSAGPRIEPNHTKALAVLFMLLGSTLVSVWAPGLGAGADGLLGDSAAAGQLHPICSSHDDQLSAQQQDQHQPATQCTLQMGE